MPVLPIVSQSIKLGLKYVPAAPPPLVAGLTTLSQVMMCMGALQPMLPIPIPVLPIGAAVSQILTMLEAMLFAFFEIIAKIINQMIQLYNQQKKVAMAARIAAEEKLYADLITAQKQVKLDVAALLVLIANLQKEIKKLQATQESEMLKYKNTLFNYREKAKAAEDSNDLVGRNSWLAKATALDPWLAKIILMTIDIINKKIDLRSAQQDLAEKQPLANMIIVKNWAQNVNQANDFNVPVPYHPDLPPIPSLPTLPAIPKEPDIVKAMRKALAKWLTSPTVPPIGIVVSAIFQMLMGLIPNNPPQVSAQMEAQADSFLLMLGGCF